MVTRGGQRCLSSWGVRQALAQVLALALASNKKGDAMEVGRIAINYYDTRTLAEKVQSFVAIVESPSVKAERKARPSWDQYWMESAVHAATRSTCPRAQVGCVMVRIGC